MIKIFGVGNILLCDEGIGVRVVEQLSKEILEITPNIEVLIGETDFFYCLDYVEGEDLIIIIDSTYMGVKPGRVNKLSFEQCDSILSKESFSHDESFLKILRREYRDISGYVIGIEIGEMKYSLELSNILQEKFNEICEEVLNNIEIIVNEFNNSIGEKNA